MIVGFFETFAAGWVYGMSDQIKSIGKAPVYTYMLANFGSVALACGIWFGLDNVWGGFVALVGFYFVVNMVTVYFLKGKKDEEPDKWTWKTIIWEVTFKNVFDLKHRIEPTIQCIPALWCLLVKQFIPHLLIILFVNLAQSETKDGEPMFGGYGGYDMRPYQALGICTFVFAVFLFTIGMIFPCVYEPFGLPDNHPAMEFVLDNKPDKLKERAEAGEQHKLNPDDEEGEDTQNNGHHDDSHDLKKDVEEDAGAAANVIVAEEEAEEVDA